ncbi:hypothetical protein LV164_008754 [Aspergillus fumigatus]|nr:hypothetical protein LV164_008754 [Aspergillus fumigatus]
MIGTDEKSPPPYTGSSMIPDPQLRQLPPVGPCGLPNTLPVLSLNSTESHLPTFRPVNGVYPLPQCGLAYPAPPPHSVHTDFRQRRTYTPREQSSSGDVPYEPNYYQIQAFGMRQRKAARAQLEKATQRILDKIQYLEDMLDERLIHFQTVQIQHEMTLSKISNEVGVKEPKMLAVKDAARSMPPKQTLDGLVKSNAAVLLLESNSKNGAGMQQLDSNEPPGQSYLEREDGELSMPVEHTTAAHKLLSWPSVRNLLYPREYDEDYVMKLEEQRGLIRIYGRGEGDDMCEDRMSPTPLSNPNSSSGWEDSHAHRAAPSSPWAQSAHPSGFPQKLRDKGVDEFGTLCADPDTIRRYHRSYLEHIHKLHPFLDQGDLDKKIEMFIKLHCLPKTAGLTPTGTGDMLRGAERKRPCDTLQGAACDFPIPTVGRTEATSRRIERSIDNAVLLLVLALGSICEVGAPVPGPVTDNPPDFRKQWIPGPPTRSVLSPAESDIIFPVHGGAPHTIPYPSPVDDRRSIRGPLASLGGDVPANQHLRNVDVIPGLSYYAYATQILGELQGANGLPHVQAALLAGLYAGQLAHPFQSHGWIYQAARACQVLVRS